MQGIGAAFVAGILSVVGVVIANQQDEGSSSPPSQAGELSGAVDNATNAPHETPRSGEGSGVEYPIAGDDSEFVKDVTMPDRMIVSSNRTFVKTWEIRNSGSVPWYDRYLVRQPGTVESGGCISDSRVRVPDTAPGRTVQISVQVSTSGAPGRCYVEWKMTDRDGKLVFPAKRGVWFDITVTNP
jgi:hypothetical protein